jgi:hypothetical protein
MVLLQMAELMNRAGCHDQSGKTLQVVLLFPSYAHRYFGGAENTTELVNSIVEDARKSLQKL